MRHLKRFNESQEELNLQREELRDFCETYLAYLLDEGFELKIYGGTKLAAGVTPFQISLVKQDKSIFLWQDIINQFLPFLKFLKDNYNLEKVNPSSNVSYHRKTDIKFVDYKWHSIFRQSKGLLEERHKALDRVKLREVYFMVTIK
jgi:hypothetical protein